MRVLSCGIMPTDHQDPNVVKLTLYAHVFADHLRYAQLLAFDRALNHLDEVYKFTASPHQIVSEASDERQLIVAERGPLLFVFNFSPSHDCTGLKVWCHAIRAQRTAAPNFELAIAPTCADGGFK
jgi:hypothetical protein